VGAAGKCQLTGKTSGFSAVAWNEYGLMPKSYCLKQEISSKRLAFWFGPGV
jgi:hypothetical protein